MSLTFPTTTQKKPSGLTALPNQVKRPGFGTLHGFDAQGGVSSVTQVDVVGTTSELQARSGDPAGFMAFNTTTSDIWVFDGGSIWLIYNNDS